MKKSGLLLAHALMQSAAFRFSEQGGFSTTSVRSSFVEPDWKRKKCKSCRLFSKHVSKCAIGVYTSPNQQACNHHQKRR